MRCITTWIFKRGEPIELLKRFWDLEGTALLYSGGDLDSAKDSFLCLFPEDKIQLKADRYAWSLLKEKWNAKEEDALSHLPEWIGYLGYEMGCYTDPDLSISHFPSRYPDALFYRPSVVVHFNHETNQAFLFAKKTVSLERSPIVTSLSPLKVSFLSDTQESYIEKIHQIKEWILDGELYQVNLSQEYHLEGRTAPFSYFEQICCLNPAPFSAFLNCGAFCLVSSSPERFLKKRGAELETRPIKGTMPRGKNPNQDAQNKKDLQSSEKERAELLMITDLMRNDLGKISDVGTVKTEEIWRCEAYQNVFHLLSIIKGRAQRGLHATDILKALFPGGSITGCPKLRAMQAIYQLEKRPRGIYTGSIGYLAGNGGFDFNIAIRTLVVEKNLLRIQLGGGIVIDSDPLKEYEETLHKGRSLFTVLGAKELVIG